MRIVRIHQFGPPDVLSVEEREAPQAGPGQVVIAVEVVGVGFSDTTIRAGKFSFPLPLPLEPGWLVGGRVIHGDPTLVGEPVVALLPAGGGYSERVVADVTNVFSLPKELSVEQALGVFVAAGTAISILRTVQIKAGETVLITAAAGNTGSQLVQLAKAAGAGTVIGAAGGKEKGAVVSRLGADVVIDYREDDWGEQVRNITGGKGADVVIDAVGGPIGRQAFEVTAHGGRLAVYGTSSGIETTIGLNALAMRGITVIGALGIAMTRTQQEVHADMETALHEAATGRLVAVIGQRYPLERAADAHAAIEARQATGMVLLIP